MADPGVRQPATNQQKRRVKTQPRKRLRVVLVDDHELVRHGLRFVLERIQGAHVVGEASDGRSALQRVDVLRPDVVILDLTMPDMDGFELLREIRRCAPTVRCIVVSIRADEAAVREAISLGAVAYLVKDGASDEIELALNAIWRGGLYLSGNVSRFAAGTPASSSPRDARGISQLTARQREILTLVASGLTTQAIAHKLAISVKTVETHRTQLMDRLGLHDVASLVRFAMREGLISRD